MSKFQEYMEATKKSESQQITIDELFKFVGGLKKIKNDYAVKSEALTHMVRQLNKLYSQKLKEKNWSWAKMPNKKEIKEKLDSIYGEK